MKKVDIIVIFIVLLISISFYIIFYKTHPITEDMIVEITYKSVVIYEVDLEETTNIMVNIKTSDKKLYVKVDLDKDGTYDIEKPPIIIDSDAEIENTVDINYKDKSIKMHYANCKNKYCYNMRIGRYVSSPIICTNGIIVSLVSDESRGTIWL